MAVFKKAGYWWIDYYDEHNARKRKKIGRSKKVAQDTLEEVKTQVRQKQVGILQKPSAKPISIKDFFFQECFEYFKTNLSTRTAKRYKAPLYHFYYFVSRMPKVKLLSHLQPQHFEKYKSHRKSVPFPKGINYFERPLDEIKGLLDEAKSNGGKVAGDNTVNFELSTLRNVCNLAIRWGYLSVNPTKGIKALTVTDAKKPRFLSREEVGKLLASCTDEMRLIFKTFLLTGMRSGELVNLEWEDIDFKNRVIRIRNKEHWQPKHRHERDIPIHEDLLPLLKKRRATHGKEEHAVFPLGSTTGYSENMLRRALMRATKEAGFPDVTKVHSLRHTFGSQLVLQGVDLPTVRDLMGHKDIETTMIYVHRMPDHLVRSVNRLKVQ